MGTNGVCSTDHSVKILRENIAEAEIEIARILSRIPHCEVTGAFVTYNRSTARDDSALFEDGKSTGIRVQLLYKI